jgi:hypothetical protein
MQASRCMVQRRLEFSGSGGAEKKPFAPLGGFPNEQRAQRRDLADAPPPPATCVTSTRPTSPGASAAASEDGDMHKAEGGGVLDERHESGKFVVHSSGTGSDVV